MGSWTAENFRSCIEELDVDAFAGLYAGDAVLDLTIGPWRYQRPGAHAIAEPYRQGFLVGTAVETWRERPAAWGAVDEVEGRLAKQAAEMFYRGVHLFSVEEGVIVEDVIYCNGGWDEATRQRWRREAPMVRR